MTFDSYIAHLLKQMFFCSTSIYFATKLYLYFIISLDKYLTIKQEIFRTDNKCFKTFFCMLLCVYYTCYKLQIKIFAIFKIINPQSLFNAACFGILYHAVWTSSKNKLLLFPLNICAIILHVHANWQLVSLLYKANVGL